MVIVIEVIVVETGTKTQPSQPITWQILTKKLNITITKNNIKT